MPKNGGMLMTCRFAGDTRLAFALGRPKRYNAGRRT